jgi:hypothetical protein
VIFAAALLGLSFAHAEPLELTITVGDDLGPWKAQNCVGESADVRNLPPCFQFVTAAGAKLRVDRVASATVAGISGGTRVVYAGANGKRGAKLGEVQVGTKASPIGITCDLSDQVTSSGTIYRRITDPRVPELLRGYITGCTP